LFANRPPAEEAVILVLNWSTEFSSRIAQFGCRLWFFWNNQALTAEEMSQRLKVLVVGCSSGVGFQVTLFSPQSFVSFVISYMPEKIWLEFPISGYFSFDLLQEICSGCTLVISVILAGFRVSTDNTPWRSLCPFPVVYTLSLYLLDKNCGFV
jgi:hypothetical protein